MTRLTFTFTRAR